MSFAAAATRIVASARKRRSETLDVLAALLCLAALTAWTFAPAPATLLPMADTPGSDRPDTRPDEHADPRDRSARWEHLVGGYGGGSFTAQSPVRVVNPGRTDFTASDFNWIGRPFKSPIYYGLRSQHWAPASPFGGMFDFTHAKAIAQFGDVATFTGSRDGQPMPPKAKIEDVFRHLEFSHGHNILTLNGLLRLPAWSLPIRPYIGLGGGITLPHTEIGLRNENTRTYEYQFAGYVGQVLVGVQIPIGRVAAFAEYKFTYAPYSVPLSHEPNGDILFTDLWRQFRAWFGGEAPPGGTLTTTLATSHAIGGILIRAAP